MKQDTDSLDAMIIYMLVQKLDNETARDWELQISDKYQPYNNFTPL